jgi:hypothetical protein
MKDLTKVERVIDSCKTRQQLNAAIKYLGLYHARELKRKDHILPRGYSGILSRKIRTDRKFMELYSLICRAQRLSRWIEWGEQRNLEGILTDQ